MDSTGCIYICVLSIHVTIIKKTIEIICESRRKDRKYVRGNSKGEQDMIIGD